MLGTALIDALPTILMDTSTYDLIDFGSHAKVRENQFLLMSVSFFHLLGLLVAIGNSWLLDKHWYANSSNRID